VNLIKFSFLCNAVVFHGFVLSTDGLQLDPQKVEAIKELPLP
jgi:hypothetical protein